MISRKCLSTWIFTSQVQLCSCAYRPFKISRFLMRALSCSNARRAVKAIVVYCIMCMHNNNIQKLYYSCIEVQGLLTSLNILKLNACQLPLDGQKSSSIASHESWGSTRVSLNLLYTQTSPECSAKSEDTHGNLDPAQGRERHIFQNSYRNCNDLFDQTISSQGLCSWDFRLQQWDSLQHVWRFSVVNFCLYCI